LSDAEGAAAAPLISIIIPPGDEARATPTPIRPLLPSPYRDLDWIWSAAAPTDGPGPSPRAFDDPRAISIAGEEPPPGWLGKPWALHQGSRRARGELLLFIDADIIYEPDALAAVIAAFERGGRDMLTFLPDIRMQGFWENAVMPNLATFAF